MANTSTKSASTPDGSKALLLAAAIKLFSEKSFDAVGTRELTEEAGVNLASIKYHFGSKSELFLAAVSSVLAETEDEMPMKFLTSPSTSRDEALKTIGNFIVRFVSSLVKKNKHSGCRMLFRETLSDASDSSEMRDSLVTMAVTRFMAPTFKLLEAHVAVACPNNSDGDNKRIAHGIISLAVFVVTHRPFLEKMANSEIDEPETLKEKIIGVLKNSDSLLNGGGALEKHTKGVLDEISKGKIIKFQN